MTPDVPFSDRTIPRKTALTLVGLLAATAVGVAIYLLVPGAGSGDVEDAGVTAARRAATCETPAGGSRWEVRVGQYRKTHDYGRRGDGWFQEITSVDPAPGGGVYVYDARRGVVTALDTDLDSVAGFGGLGGGPGELAGFMIARPGFGEWLTVGDSVVYVYDGRAVNSFTLEGRFLEQERFVPGSVAPFSVTAIDAARPRFLFAVDADETGQENRRLQTWSVSPEGADPAPGPLFEIGLVPAPSEGGVTYHSENQPQPLWAVRGPCIFASDGEHGWIVRYNRTTGEEDTLRLPEYEVDEEAQRSDIDPSRVQSGVTGLIRARTGEEPPSLALPSLESAGVLRWTDMIVDPDGYVWVRLWRDEPDEGESLPVPIYRVDPGSGEVERTTVPAFPVAFGEPGTYFARMEDPVTGEVYVARFAR